MPETISKAQQKRNAEERKNLKGHIIRRANDLVGSNYNSSGRLRDEMVSKSQKKETAAMKQWRKKIADFDKANRKASEKAHREARRMGDRVQDLAYKGELDEAMQLLETYEAMCN